MHFLIYTLFPEVFRQPYDVCCCYILTINICEIMVFLLKLSEIQHGIEMGCNLCSLKRSLQWNIIHSTVTGITPKWKLQQMRHEGVGLRVKEQCQWVLRSTKKSPPFCRAIGLQTSCGLQINSGTVCRELHRMNRELLHPILTSPYQCKAEYWCKAHSVF